MAVRPGRPLQPCHWVSLHFNSLPAPTVWPLPSLLRPAPNNTGINPRFSCVPCYPISIYLVVPWSPRRCCWRGMSLSPWPLETKQDPEGPSQVQKAPPCPLSPVESQRSRLKQLMIRTIESQNLQFLPEGHRVWCTFLSCVADTITATRGYKLTAWWWPDCSHDVSCSVLSSTESMASTIPRTGLKRMGKNWPWSWRLTVLKTIKMMLTQQATWLQQILAHHTSPISRWMRLVYEPIFLDSLWD